MGRKRLADRKGNKLPPFVAVPWVILNSTAYKKLPSRAAKALAYFLGRPKVPFSSGQYLRTDFSFTYPEARQLGFASATWAKVLRDLVEYGFIDPRCKGGLRGMGKTSALYRLSDRWSNYGQKDFVRIDLKTWGT